MRIIPAIDIIDGKCVRLTQGDYQRKKVYNENPVEVAKHFEAMGIRYLHLVDLDGAKSKKVINLKVLEEISRQTQLKVDFGGGVQSYESARDVFEAGAQQVTLGSIAVKKPAVVDQCLETFGSERIILGADVKGQQVAISGWQEVTPLTLETLVAKYVAKGIQYVICTDISKDGLLAGPSFSLYVQLIKRFPSVHLIASGGVTTIEDIGKLAAIRLEGVIIGKALYEGTITTASLKSYLQARPAQ
ncbi:MAG: 1-(5-phosphoribosyl)-5-[(5-phosphoribosylamino)methylideneamino]imidazole-4-carboxamide isomerase [Thermonemataceae bacterium]